MKLNGPVRDLSFFLHLKTGVILKRRHEENIKKIELGLNFDIVTLLKDIEKPVLFAFD